MELEIIEVLETCFHQSGESYDELQLMSDGKVRIQTFRIPLEDLDDAPWDLEMCGFGYEDFVE